MEVLCSMYNKTSKGKKGMHIQKKVQEIAITDEDYEINVQSHYLYAQQQAM